MASRSRGGVPQGTESVKEFLVAKLKETEAALKRSLDEKGQTMRQAASDQEVISFLDSRTQVIRLRCLLILGSTRKFRRTLVAVAPEHVAMPSIPEVTFSRRDEACFTRSP